MTEYRVRWEIEVDADTPRQAAERALEMQRDPSAIATVFEVAPPSGEPLRQIDLAEPADVASDERAGSAPADAEAAKVEQEPVQDEGAGAIVVINVSGGVVQDVFVGNGQEPLEAIVVDWDTEICTPGEQGILAITDEHGDQQLAAVIRHHCVPLAALEGTDIGKALRAAGGDEPLASLLSLNESHAVLTDPTTSSALQAVPSAVSLLSFAEELVRLLHGDEETGRLTSQNTLAARSGADFIDALELLLSRHGIAPRLEEP